MKFIKSSAIALLLLPIIAQANCGSAFCTLSTDWDVQGQIQSMSNKTGVRLDLRAEYINQDQLRSGSSDSSPRGEVDEHDELRTINRNYLATLDWNINPIWGVTLELPLVSRSHAHILNADDGAGGIAPETESWSFTGIGDIQALARYRVYANKDSNAGLRFGLKLPTGSINKSNGSELAERMLQPGTGSVDSLLGAYYNKRVGATNWFVQGMWQQALSERDNFKPGRKLNLDAGASYSLTPDLSLMLQMNAQHKSKDSGSNAEPAESGGYTISVSPGASYRVTPNTSVYGFVQTPLVERVNGTQLTADWSAVLGLSTQF